VHDSFLIIMPLCSGYDFRNCYTPKASIYPSGYMRLHIYYLIVPAYSFGLSVFNPTDTAVLLIYNIISFVS